MNIQKVPRKYLKLSIKLSLNIQRGKGIDSNSIFALSEFRCLFHFVSDENIIGIINKISADIVQNIQPHQNQLLILFLDDSE